MKKRKIGIFFILIGIGFPLVLFFFQDDGYFDFGNIRTESIERELTLDEIDAIKLKVAEDLEGVNEFDLWRMAKFLMGEEAEDNPYQKWLDYQTRMGSPEKANAFLTKWLGEDYFKNQTWTFTVETHRNIPYKYTIGIGLILFLFGIGIFIFSYFPKEEESNKLNGDKSTQKGSSSPAGRIDS